MPWTTAVVHGHADVLNEWSQKRTESEIENLVLVASQDFWTFRHLWNVSSTSVMLYISQQVSNHKLRNSGHTTWH